MHYSKILDKFPKNSDSKQAPCYQVPRRSKRAMYAQTSRKQNIPTVVHINREEYKTTSTSRQTRVLRLNQINQKKKLQKSLGSQKKK